MTVLMVLVAVLPAVRPILRQPIQIMVQTEPMDVNILVITLVI